MKTLSRRCVYCTLLRDESSFLSYTAVDGKRVIETLDKQCEVAIWPALVAEYPQLRRIRDLLADVAWRAQPAAPSKGWERHIPTPLREGQKPDGVADNGGTLKTASNSQQDRYHQKWVNRRIGEWYEEIEKQVYPPDPSENAKPRKKVDGPRCQKTVTCSVCLGGGCRECFSTGKVRCKDFGKRQRVEQQFCGGCGQEFTTKVAAGVARDD